MDERLLSWVLLLPAGATISPWRVPDGVAALLGNRLDPAGDTWLGWEPAVKDLPDLSQFQAVVLVKPRGVLASSLHAQGFTRIRSFAVVSSLSEPRWFIPDHSKTAALAAWDLYSPIRRRARLSKAVATALTRSGWISRVGDHMVVARRQDSLLEEVLQRVVGSHAISIAIASGTPGPRRKLTVQASTDNGSVLAYAKFGEPTEAAMAVRREAKFLARVGRLGLRTTIIPSLLHHGSHTGGYLMVTTPLATRLRASQAALTQRHVDVLLEFASRTGTSSMLDLLQRLDLRVTALAHRISPEWHRRLSLAVAAIRSTPGMNEFGTALAHGDFAPWNIKSEPTGGRLAIIDWEQGSEEQFLLWDAFHFRTQVALLVDRVQARAGVAGILYDLKTVSLVRALGISAPHVTMLYMAYLADSIAQWFEERSDSAATTVVADNIQSQRGLMLEAVMDAHRIVVTGEGRSERRPRLMGQTTRRQQRSERGD